MTQFECLQSHLANLKGKLFVLRETPSPDRFLRYIESARTFLDWLRKCEANGLVTFTQYRELSREYGRLDDEFSLVNQQYIAELVDDPSIEPDRVHATNAALAPVASRRVMRLHSLLVKQSTNKSPDIQKTIIAAWARTIGRGRFTTANQFSARL